MMFKMAQEVVDGKDSWKVAGLLGLNNYIPGSESSIRIGPVLVDPSLRVSPPLL